MGQNAQSKQADEGTAAPLLLYRSAMKGSISMIGNFVYPYSSMVWISFGIPDLDGLFYVQQKVDDISKEDFKSTYTFQAEGSNPLGVPRKPDGTLEDVIRSNRAEAEGAANFSSQPIGPINFSPLTQETQAESVCKSPVAANPGGDIIAPWTSTPNQSKP